ncbi:MAG: hypothetical protein ACI4RP_06360 [Acutalibacteraceae bacterium]
MRGNARTAQSWINSAKRMPPHPAADAATFPSRGRLTLVSSII